MMASAELMMAVTDEEGSEHSMTRKSDDSITQSEKPDDSTTQITNPQSEKSDDSTNPGSRLRIRLADFVKLGKPGPIGRLVVAVKKNQVSEDPTNQLAKRPKLEDDDDENIEWVPAPAGGGGLIYCARCKKGAGHHIYHCKDFDPFKDLHCSICDILGHRIRDCPEMEPFAGNCLGYHSN